MERLTPVKKNIKRVAKAYKKYAEVDTDSIGCMLDRAMKLSAETVKLTEGNYTKDRAIKYLASNIELVGVFARILRVNDKLKSISSKGLSDLVSSMEPVLDKLSTPEVATYPAVLDKVAETLEVAVKKGVSVAEVIEIDIDDEEVEEDDEEIEEETPKSKGKTPLLTVGAMWLSLSQATLPDEGAYEGYSATVEKDLEMKAIGAVQFSVYTLLSNLVAGARQMQGSSKSVDTDEIIEEIIERGCLVGREEAFKLTLQEVVETLESVKVSEKGSINGKSSVGETVIVNVLYSLISMSSIPKGINAKTRKSLSGVILTTVASVSKWAGKDTMELFEKFESIVNNEATPEMTLQEFAEEFLN